MNSRIAKRSRLIPRTVLAFIGAVLGGMWSGASGAQEPPTPVTAARPCATLAVYRMGTPASWDARTRYANVLIEAAAERGQLPDCSNGLSAALTEDFSPALWQVSLAIVDSVLDRRSEQPSDACVRSTATLSAVRLSPADVPTAPPLAADRTQCVTYPAGGAL